MLQYRKSLSNNSRVEKNGNFDTVKSKDFLKVPVFSNAGLPQPHSKRARQGDIAFRQSATANLASTSGELLFFNGTQWVSASDYISLAAVDSSGVANVNGATLAGNQINFNASNFVGGVQYPGVLSTGAQVIGGIKTFTNAINMPATASASVGLITVNGAPFLHSYSTGAIKNVFLGIGNGSLTATGQGNVGIGTGTMSTADLSGNNNVAIGNGAMDSAISTSNNVAIGQNALFSATSAGPNIAIGQNAARFTNGGVGNVAMGVSALGANVSGSNNIALGDNALQLNTTGSSNVAIGPGSILSLLTGSHNIIIGNASGNAYTGAETRNIVIGNSGLAGESNVIRLGSALNTGNILIGAQLANGETNVIRIGTTHSAAFIQGISGVVPTGPLYQVLVNGSGQLGASTIAGSGVNAIGPIVAPVNEDGLVITVSGTTTTLQLQQADATRGGALSDGTQDIPGTKTFVAGIRLPTTLGTASLFDYYEEYTIPAVADVTPTAFDAGVTPANGVTQVLVDSIRQRGDTVTPNLGLRVSFVRIGKVVTCTIPAFNFHIPTIPGVVTAWNIVGSRTAIPTRFLPEHDLRAYVNPLIANTVGSSTTSYDAAGNPGSTVNYLSTGQDTANIIVAGAPTSTRWPEANITGSAGLPLYGQIWMKSFTSGNMNQNDIGLYEDVVLTWSVDT